MYVKVTAADLQQIAWMKFKAWANTNKKKGGIDMSKGKNTAQNQEKQPQDKKPTTPGDIKGKIEVPDTRERKDGPGGN